MDEMERIETVIAGAGPAGLAASACLRRAGLPFVILEQGDRAGASWARHYDRLHLHTESRHSGLPYAPWPKGSPRYPSRDEVLAYLDRYAAGFDLRPRFGQCVCSAERRDGVWLI